MCRGVGEVVEEGWCGQEKGVGRWVVVVVVGMVVVVVGVHCC